MKDVGLEQGLELECADIEEKRETLNKFRDCEMRELNSFVGVHFGAMENKAIMCTNLFEILLSILLDTYLELELSNHLKIIKNMF